MQSKYMSLFNRVPRHREWYSLSKPNDDGVAELMIYDEIAWYAVDAQEFVGRLNALDASQINLRINSPGGSVFDGVAIYNSLKAHKAKITTYIDGVAASIASIIALAGDEVRMAKNAMFMVHDPWALVVGNASDLRNTAETLDKVAGTLVQTYVNASTLDADEVRAAMLAETWYTAEEAKDIGFVDKVTGDVEIEARFDLSVYNHAPEQFNAGLSVPDSIKDFERLLRDVGFSRKDAKAIAGHGFGALSQRDADPVATAEQEADRAAALYLKLREITR